MTASIPLRLAGGLLLLTVVGALVAGAVTGDATRAALAEGGPACLFRWVFHFVCPFCGMTHATLALGAGEWREAFSHHPLAPAVALAIAWCGFQLLRGRPLSIFGRRLGPVPILAATAAVWAANLLAHT